MKAVAILLIVLCLAAFAGIGYLYLTTNLSVTAADCIAVDPATQPDVFAQLKRQLEGETFIGTVFSSEMPENPQDWQFYTYTVHLDNRTFLQAEVIEFQIAPMAGDLLQPGDTQALSLRPRSSGDFTVSLLTARDMHPVRELTVSWYFAGLPFSEKITVGR